MCGNIEFKLWDENGDEAASMSLCFEDKKDMQTIQSMIDAYLYALLEKMEREEAPTCANG